MRVPFGWHRALDLVQHLNGALLFELPDAHVVIVQYVDDMLFVDRDRLLTIHVARDTAAHLARKGFRGSPKSVLNATQSLSWMGKQLSLHWPRTAHKPEGLANIVGRWVAFNLSRYTCKPLQRVLGCIGWLARPSFWALCLLAGARAWLRPDPPFAHWVPFAVCREGPVGGNFSGESGVGTAAGWRTGYSRVHRCCRFSMRAWRVLCRGLEL